MSAAVEGPSGAGGGGGQVPEGFEINEKGELVPIDEAGGGGKAGGYGDEKAGGDGDGGGGGGVPADDGAAPKGDV